MNAYTLKSWVALLFLLGLMVPYIAEAAPFENGDAFASISSGNVLLNPDLASGRSQ